jgi:hypothetical protein
MDAVCVVATGSPVHSHCTTGRRLPCRSALRRAEEVSTTHAHTRVYTFVCVGHVLRFIRLCFTSLPIYVNFHREEHFLFYESRLIVSPSCVLCVRQNFVMSL